MCVGIGVGFVYFVKEVIFKVVVFEFRYEEKEEKEFRGNYILCWGIVIYIWVSMLVWV